MKIKYREPSMKAIVNVKPGEVVLFEDKYYLCADTVRVDEVMLVDIESGKVFYIDNAVKVSVCKGAIMNPLG